MTDRPKPLILNVDDTDTSRLTTTLVLRQAGFDVVEAATGAEALRLAEQLPSLVLLDVNLPDINGFEVCRQLKSSPHTRAIAVVHLSASYVTSQDRVAGLDEGADGYLTQPVEPRELVATIRAFLRLKSAEEALRESERWHRVLFEGSHDALMTLTPPSWRFTSGNPASIAMFRAKDEREFLRHAPWEYSPERQPDGRTSADKAQEMVEGALCEGSRFFEWTHQRATGEVFPASVLLTRIEAGDQPMLLATVRDESEKKRLEASVVQADRLASMGLLAAGLAHELNNPLAYVHFSVESLAEDLPRFASAARRCSAALREKVGDAAYAGIVGDGASMLEPAMFEDAIERTKEALDGTQRMKAITRGLNMFSRVEQDELGPVNLQAALESAITVAASKLRPRARLVRDYQPISAVWASEGKLSQVFLNLLLRAAQAIDEDGSHDNQITLCLRAEGDDVLVTLTDTARGLPPEALDRLFEPSFTATPAGLGTGLGLSLCKSIVTEFGGELRVESDVVRGTRFVLRLPVAPGAVRQSREVIVSATAGGPAPVRGRVLVVDDEEAIRRSMEHLLGRDHEIVTVASAEQAQALLEKDPAFDAIICDLMMAGMSGMDLHAWLALRDPSLAAQLVFVTGGAFTPKASEYLARVGNLTLEKPVDGKDLKRTLSGLVQVARTRNRR
jgi:two-component system, cell cycle sensor histidine kinase and response regulator CckA